MNKFQTVHCVYSLTDLFFKLFSVIAYEVYRYRSLPEYHITIVEEYCIELK
jgi:hypothetical protein